jgi:hypothetical protein
MRQSRPQPQRNAAQIVEDQKELKRTYHRLFTSTDGWAVFHDLKDRFAGDLVGGDAHRTAVNVGSFRVIQLIQDMMEGPHGDT